MTELELLSRIILEITDDKENLVYVKNKVVEEKTDDRNISFEEKQ